MVWNLVSWYFVILLLGWLTFPITHRLFNRLPDRGYSLSRILGLLLWGFGFWLLGSIRLLQAHPGGILFALFLLLGCCFWAGWKKWGDIWKWIQTNWRLVLMAEVVFLVGYAFMALVRASNPDATGTEKPMELAFINAILKSETFPPHDPWLSGYAISYYHFGYILAAMLARVTATSGSVAFNLMLALIFGMSAIGAYGVVYNLISVFEKHRKETGNQFVWALLGPLYLLFISNLVGVLEMLYQAGVGWNMATGTSRFWEWINIDSFRSPPSPPLTLIPQRFWWWWQSSRVIHDIDLLGNISGLSPIDEFPAFSFVLGDLHPHVLVIPFVLLLIGLSLNVMRGAMIPTGKSLGIKMPYRMDLFIVSAITLGGIAFLNTWDLPVYFVLLTGAFLIQQSRDLGWDWVRIKELLWLAVPLGAASLLLYTPFYVSFQSQAGGILPNLIYPTRGLYLWLMFGSLFIPIFMFFGWLWREKMKADWHKGMTLVVCLIVMLYLVSIMVGFRLAQTPAGQQLIASQGELSYSGLLLSALGHRFRFGVSLLSLAGLLLGSLAYLLALIRKTDQSLAASNSVLFVLWIIMLGGLMVLAPEFVYLRDHFGTRMNTVFKFYYQAWMLWSLAGAFGTVVLLRKGSWLTRILVVTFLLMGLVYPVLAYPNKTRHFNPVEGYTLDAGAYLWRSQPNEAVALDWLAKAPPGVVAEAVGGQYTGFARVSTHSGQPTVLGWPGHQGQWRGGYEEVGSRELDIRNLYETSSWQTALEIIRQYDIRYIYLGSLEMSSYAVNPGKFEQNLEVVFEQGGIRIFKVPLTIRQ